VYLVYLPYASGVELANADATTQAVTAETVAAQAEKYQRRQFVLHLIGTGAAVAVAIATIISLRKRGK
jgi:L-amino acid N-acyltransferase YncA